MAGGKLWNVLKRKLDYEPILDTGNLKRCLNQWDVTALGVGSTLGIGVYVLIGSVALHYAGPSIVISFAIAAVASLFAGLCYAEFSSRVSRAGSAYVYAYVSIGEFAAFIVGWTLLLDGLFGAASVARGLSLYVDAVANNSISDWFIQVAPISAAPLSAYFDFLSCFIVLLIGVLLSVGVRKSFVINNVFVAINLIIIVFIIIVGAFQADVNNWNIVPAEIPAGFGVGGFFPYGIWGMLRGAAICFYGFVGFDTISYTGEEVRSPRSAIPWAMLITLTTCLLTYMSVSTVVTMMVPYHLQDTVGTMITAFRHVGWSWAGWVVGIGAIFGICASLLGAMYSMTRLLYSMASDGLFLHWFAKVTSKQKSPLVATLVSTAIIAILAAIFDLDQLIMTMCIGTLLSYTTVAAGVILLRFGSAYDTLASFGFWRRLFGCGERAPTYGTAAVVHIALAFFVCTCLTSALVTVHASQPLIPVIILHVVALLPIIIITLQPQNKEDLKFRTPLVPIIPCLSIYVNIHLMVLINVNTWIRVAIWILIGILVYILCVCIYKRKGHLEENIKHTKVQKNGNPPQIVVESPTPPNTMTGIRNTGENKNDQQEEIQLANVEYGIEKIEENIVMSAEPITEKTMHFQIIESNAEKEAKIIDLLDQVLQAEEDTYSEIMSYKEKEEDGNVSAEQGDIPHRKSFSDLSDAGSDASLGNQGLSKYDVIAQVHREDLPKLIEEDDKNNNIKDDDFDPDQEQVTAFNESDTNSRTDESGYSDTLDKNVLNESTENVKEDIPYIPEPPPLDENYFKNPTFKKSYTISVSPRRNKEEEMKPRTSNLSNNSQDDGTMVFGSDKQMNFMSKLNNILQNKIYSSSDEERIDNPEEPKQRSQSFSNVTDNSILTVNPERSAMFLDLQKEIVSREKAQNLRPINTESDGSSEDEDTSLSREDLKSKLEGIFALNGTVLLKPRLMRSNPPTPEDTPDAINASAQESLPKMPKMGKNDTLGRQKARFGEVLSSLRLSMNNDEKV